MIIINQTNFFWLHIQPHTPTKQLKRQQRQNQFANLIQVNCALLRPVVILLELGLYSCLNLRLWSLSFSVGLQCSKPRPLHLPYRMAQARRCKTIADILHVTNLKCECRKHVSTGHREGVLPARYNHKGHWSPFTLLLTFLELNQRPNAETSETDLTFYFFCECDSLTNHRKS